MEAEITNEMRTASAPGRPGQRTAAHALQQREAPYSAPVGRPALPAGTRLGIPKEWRGGGARSAALAEAPQLHRPPSGQGPSPAPPTRAGGGRPRAGLAPPPPLPLPAQTKEPRRAAGLRRRRAKSEWRARARPGARGPARRSPGSARLPGVTGVPVDRVAEAGAPPQRGPEERGPEDSPQQGQQPHRPRGPVRFGLAGPGPLRSRGEKGTKWRGGVVERGWVRTLPGHAPG